MRRQIYFLMAALMLALPVIRVQAAEIVVLTEEPVEVFVLPDESVLHNAYVWRRTSAGLMIIHDGGQYFLNYSTLPPEWKKAYFGEEEDAADENAKKEELEEAGGSRYRVGNILDGVPLLTKEAREKLLERNRDRDLDQGVLILALLQATLNEDREIANRCILYLEELDYETKEVKRDKLFEVCYNCGGEGTVTRRCRACDGSGECSKCKEAVTTLGKRSSRDKQTMTELGKRSSQDTDCKACEGTGQCPGCGGSGEAELQCATCKGSGKVVARVYCESVRDKWVREMNARVSGNPPATIMASPSVDIGAILKQLPGLNTNAAVYYTSDDYDGGMDTNIVAACLMHTLVDQDLRSAKRFNVLLDVEYPDNEVLEVGDYLKFCKTCDSRGWCEQACPRCGGSGECEKCEGDGDSMNLKSWEVVCSDCDGTGECPGCGGSGQVSGRCRTCMGLGRIFEKPRCEIRLELLVDDLNQYYRKKRAESQ